MSEETNWQPVRMASSKNKILCGRCGPGLGEWNGIWEMIEHEIIHVRRVAVEECIMDENDKEAFEIHPDDLARLNIENIGTIVCEHMILCD